MEPYLFNEISNERAEEFRKYMPVNINLRFETVAPFLVLTEQKYIVPLLGQPLFDRISSPVGVGQQQNRTQLLIDLVRFAEIRLAVWSGFDSLQSVISDTGVSSNVEKDNRLYRYQEENIKNALKNEGFDQLDMVLSFLEKNIDEFPEFEHSEYYARRNDNIINDTADFDACYPINGSRLVFLKMKPFIQFVEDVALQHRIGEDFYNELRTADTSEEKYARVMPLIKRFIVYSAVADGIGELHKMPTEKGLVFESNKADGVEVSPLELEHLNSTRSIFARKADAYIDTAIHTMQRHREDYPAYFAFAGNSPADGVIHINNDNRKIFLT